MSIQLHQQENNPLFNPKITTTPMKIQYASDLHLEFDDNKGFIHANPLKPAGEILILAGDITYLTPDHFADTIFEKLSGDFQHVYLIPGNHEFYKKHQDIAEVLPVFQRKVRENVTYLNNEVIYFKSDLRIIFTTLWTHLSPSKSFSIESKLNDFNQSVYGGERFTSERYNHCHQVCREFLESELQNPFSGKTIVASHHVPFPSKYCKYPFAGDELSEAFHVDLLDMISKYRIDHWVYGHNHLNMEPFELHGTHFHANQLGYVFYGEHKAFRPDALIEV